MSAAVTIFVTSTCPWCHRLREYLTRREIAFEAVDIGIDRSRAKEVKEISGQLGVPVTKIGDHVIIGFDRDAIDEALEGEGLGA